MLNIYSNRRAFSSASGHSTVLPLSAYLPTFLLHSTPPGGVPIQEHFCLAQDVCCSFPVQFLGATVFRNSCAPVLPPLRLQHKTWLDYSNTVGECSCYFANLAANDAASEFCTELTRSSLRYPFHSPAEQPNLPTPPPLLSTPFPYCCPSRHS